MLAGRGGANHYSDGRPISGGNCSLYLASAARRSSVSEIRQTARIDWAALAERFSHGAAEAVNVLASQPWVWAVIDSSPPAVFSMSVIALPLSWDTSTSVQISPQTP